MPTASSNQPLRTSTIKDGGADTINIKKGGSVVLTGDTAVTMDGNHAVSNAGAVAISNANGAIGIRAVAGTSGDIVNTGTQRDGRRQGRRSRRQDRGSGQSRRGYREYDSDQLTAICANVT